MKKRKKITNKIADKILADIDDEMWLLKKRIELKYELNWAQARDATNESIRKLYCFECEFKEASELNKKP